MQNLRSTSRATICAAALLAPCTGAQANPIVEGSARFTVITPECIRLEYSTNGAFIDDPSLFAVNRSDFTEPTGTEHTPDGALVINTGRMRLEYKPDGGPFSEENLRVEIAGGDRVIEWTPASKQTQNLGGTIHTLDQVRGPVDLEEGILSRNGWYLIDDSRMHLLIDDWAAPRPEDAGTDWYLFGYGKDFQAAFKAFTAAGGKVPMPRKAVLGSWYSRWWEYTTEDYKEIVREYDDNNFPLDIIVMDMEWHTGPWTGWSWNYELLPDPPALLKWFEEQGLTITMNVHPADGVAPTETMYADFMRELGEDPESGKTVTYDAANREYMDALFKHTHQPREDEGVDFWWLDWQQYPYTIGIPDLLNLKWLNYLYYKNSERNNKRGLQFSRWGDWGDHRHPIHFSGDADTGWRMLGFEVPFTSTAGNEGTYFWSHDIGGHFGDRNEEPYTRWVQFAATTAAMRLHSGIIPYLDRRPWKWADWATESMRRSFHFRSEMMPYVYSSTWQCYRDSLPLNRPMYIAYSEEADAYMAPQQYLFGEALLVAPIASAGYGPGRVGHQLVWFPEGTWYNTFTSEKFEGPQWRVVSADINEFPAFVRAGTPLPTQPYSSRPTTASLDTLIVKLWPGHDGQTTEFTLYEDDGISRDYESNGYATTLLSSAASDGVIEIAIAPVDGKYNGQVENRSYEVLLHSVEEPTSVEVNGKKANGKWNKEERTLSVTVPRQSIRNNVKIKVETTVTDAAYFQERALKRRLKGILGDDSSSSLAKAIEKASESNPEILPGLLALGGLAIIENETHYPEVGLINRVVRNNDSILSSDGISLSWSRKIVPGDKTTPNSNLTFPNFDGLEEFPSPEFTAQSLAFLTSAVDQRTLTCAIDDHPVSVTVPIGQSDGRLESWRVSPFYEYDLEKTLDEQEFEPETISSSELLKLANTADWTDASPDEKGVVDLRAIHDGENRVAYAVTTFESASSVKATLGFRSDDGIEAWVNDKKLHSNDVMRGVNHDWEEVDVTFNAGKNVILLKVSQGHGDWGFAVRGLRVAK